MPMDKEDDFYIENINSNNERDVGSIADHKSDDGSAKCNITWLVINNFKWWGRGRENGI